ncbi:acyltransferase family protein [Paracoccus siganidrum]|uniref:Acyltransferase 3 domain-containing protein n=1 Tax=Paracoccus siganidrum TaxID=1276757 RepID=A0A418ZV73_9RHOB|nr:acyltransferase [Paracoccus siganidrum]RJL02823.1 hypothetical protein D3P05_21635 [Paracoccus siganidrum]RMC29945.1 hypothetical protein C9E82_19395 [Paracoccus siganidrum]
MSQGDAVAPARDPRPDLPVETARALAIAILVSFHVIGGGEGGRGLNVPYPHGLRLYADLLIDLRMPLFAFIAGVVYALRPVEPRQLPAFLTGKLRRLALPGVTAITVFLAMAQLMGSEDMMGGRVWEAYFRHYAIFWFLQAMLLIFAVYGSADILSRGRVLLPALVLSMAAVALGLGFDSDLMAADRVTHLLAYMLLGVAFVRHHALLRRHGRAVLLLALLAMGAGLAMNIATLRATGAFSFERLDLQSLLFGGGACVAAFLLLPRLGRLQWLGACSLTIYLYHILATSASRRVLERLDVDSLAIHVLAGTALGIALPVALHMLAMRWSGTRLLVLGLRAKGAARPAALPRVPA